MKFLNDRDDMSVCPAPQVLIVHQCRRHICVCIYPKMEGHTTLRLRVKSSEPRGMTDACRYEYQCMYGCHEARVRVGRTRRAALKRCKSGREKGKKKKQ